MKKAFSRKTITVLALLGWCLLFLRCETTEKSMVRAVYLAREETVFRAGLICQAPEAAADASEASAALQYVQGEGTSMEQALAAAEDALPLPASYRLCDYLLFPDVEKALLQKYEQLVLRRGCGRTAARLVCLKGKSDALESQKELPDALMAALKAASDTMPRLYQQREALLIPCLQLNTEQETLHTEGGILHTTEEKRELSGQQAEVLRLLSGVDGVRSFWLEGEKISIRRCTVSITLQKGQVALRLDAQRLPQSPMPTETQQRQLAQECTAFVQECWQQGIDVLHLQAYAALQMGRSGAFSPTKNACPQLRTDVRFLPV